MHRSSRRAAFLVLGMSLAMLLPASVSATNSWGGYHWARTANPFTIKLGDNVASTWDSYLAATSADWSQSAVLDTTVVAGTTNARNCKATTGMVQVCNNTYGSTGWLGVAGISITGGTHITKAYVKVNDTYFKTATYDTAAWRNLVMCQEVGHAFGLDHQDTSFSNANLRTCMDYTNDPSTNQRPNAHDYDELALIYGHLDSTTTVGSAPALPSAASAGGRTADAAWGRLVKVTDQGNGAWFVRDFGNGNLELTHVLWAR